MRKYVRIILSSAHLKNALLFETEAAKKFPYIRHDENLSMRCILSLQTSSKGPLKGEPASRA